MKTPKEYTENIKKGILTKSMLKDCLFSVNKRAKNCRDKEREYRHNYIYKEKYRNQKEEYYLQKDSLLALLTPTCIHEETHQTKRRIYDYEDGYEEYLCSGNFFYENEYYDREIRDYVSFIDVWEDENKYYLFYDFGDRSFHKPLCESCLSYYPELKVIHIDSLVTYGKDIEQLISCQFVKKVLELINEKTYKLDLEN